MGKRALPRSRARSLAVGGIVVGGVAIPATFVSTASASTLSSWERVAQCESGNRWSLPFGDNGKSSGGLQFQPASWDTALSKLRSEGINTSNMPQGPGHQAYKATKNQQILAGEALLAMQGPGAWTCNAMVGSPLGASVFEGGANPFGGASLQSVANGGKVTPKPAPAPVKPKPSPKPSQSNSGEGNTGVTKGGTHTVVPGDTLYDIAIDHGVGDGGLDTWKPLYNANRGVVGDNPHLIFPGQKLSIPGKSTPVDTPAPTPAPVTPKPSGYQSPVPGGVSQSYRNPGNYAAGFHTGIDLRCSAGQAVRSAGPGSVVATGGEGAAYGNHVKVKHPDGRYTLYAHLSSVSVSNGDAVSGGAVVGTCGNTGTSTGAHLHFEVRAGNGGYNDHVDPLSWLASHGVK